MELRSLKYLVSLADSGSFTAAARERFVTQPAVSIQLRKLREELGVPLYEMSGREIRFTEAGWRVLDYARRMEDLERQMLRELDDLEGLQRGVISLGTIDAASIYVLPPVFSAFRDRYPGVELRIEVSSTLPLLAGLESGRFELIVGTLPEEESGGYDAVEVLRERLVPVAPPDHPLLRRRRGRLRALGDYPFISFHRGSVTRRLVEDALRERGVALNVSMEIDSQEAIRNLVASGLGLSILPLPTVRDEIERGRLAEIPVRGLRIERRIGLMSRRGRYLPSPARAFLRIAGEVLGLELPARLAAVRQAGGGYGKEDR
ncbi:MAG: LysR family transcriptional regulator [Candidatus Krumholzibacteria bacterium]|nr:LysR family transcriptional regulator [Candidatus Krumholzibacteria bacterium]